MLVPPPSHWQYMEFHPVIGPSFERLEHDADLYEVVTHPQPDMKWSRPVFDIFPDLDEWRSKDILRRCKDHGREHLWSYEGRLDDMMILSSGAKVNPIHTEMRLQSHPALKGCLVIGYGCTECGLLIEPRTQSLRQERVIEQVWPAVEEANSLVPKHARIAKRLVIIADPEKPLARTSKGTIIRSLTTQAYEREIQQVYSAVG